MYSSPRPSNHQFMASPVSFINVLPALLLFLCQFEANPRRHIYFIYEHFTMCLKKIRTFIPFHLMAEGHIGMFLWTHYLPVTPSGHRDSVHTCGHLDVARLGCWRNAALAGAHLPAGG